MTPTKWAPAAVVVVAIAIVVGSRMMMGRSPTPPLPHSTSSPPASTLVGNGADYLPDVGATMRYLITVPAGARPRYNRTGRCWRTSESERICGETDWFPAVRRPNRAEETFRLTMRVTAKQHVVQQHYQHELQLAVEKDELGVYRACRLDGACQEARDVRWVIREPFFQVIERVTYGSALERQLPRSLSLWDSDTPVETSRIIFFLAPDRGPGVTLGLGTRPVDNLRFDGAGQCHHAPCLAFTRQVTPPHSRDGRPIEGFNEECTFEWGQGLTRLVQWSSERLEKTMEWRREEEE